MLLLTVHSSLLLLLLLACACKGTQEEGARPSSGDENAAGQLSVAPSQAPPQSATGMHPKSVTTIAHFDDHTEIVSASTSSTTHAYITPDSLNMASVRLVDDSQPPEAGKAGEKTEGQVVAGKEVEVDCGECAGKRVAIAQLGVHVPKEKNVRADVVRAMSNIMGPQSSSSTDASGIGEADDGGAKGMAVDEQEEFNRILQEETERMNRFRSADDSPSTKRNAEIVANKSDEEALKTVVEPDEPRKEKEPPAESSPHVQDSPESVDRSKGEAMALEKEGVWGEFDEIPEGMSQSDVHQML